MSVHYKFKSALKYDTITFDGLHISVKDLKRDILQQKQIGKTGDFDLQITNAQTNEVYQDENTLIPKNSSLIVVRVPLTAQQKRAWDRQENNQQIAGLKNINTNIPPFVETQDPTAQKLAKAVDLSVLDASEDDKIMAMMTQSTLDYDPINYARIRGFTQVGEVPPNYRCYKCHQAGHWIKDCRFGINQENQPEIRKSTGIPRSFMVPVEGPSVPGAMMTPSGQFAVPSIDQQAYLEGKKPSLPAEDTMEKVTVPEDLVCSICHDLLTDAVMIPCCGSSFCDECIRMKLLESENQKCPDCKEIGVSPDTMIPNRYLRKSVDNFQNTTGYQRTQPSGSHPPSIPPPGNALVQVPLIESQPIQALGSRTARPPEIINLIESRSDTDSPIQIHSENHKSSSNRLPSLKNSIPTTNPIVPSKGGGDIARGPPSDRIPYSRQDRSSTPTVDERIPSSLPDTSVPPPTATYAITSLSANPPSFGGPPPGYGMQGGYGRGPMQYPMGSGPAPGPAPNYTDRRDMRQGYRNSYNRGGRNGRMHGGYDRRDDRRDDRNPSQRNPPQMGIDDPLSAFEKILREKDMARERRRRKRSFSRSLSPRPRSRTRSRTRSPPLRKRGSVSPSPPPARQRSLSPAVRVRGSRTPSPPPRAPRSRSPPPRASRRSRTRSPRSRTPRSRSPPPPRHRAHSFSISRSRSRSFSRTPERSPRDRHFSPRRREGSRFRSPLQGRNSPQRYGGPGRREYKEYEGQYYEGQGRSRAPRSRGYARGGRSQDSNYFPTSPSRYDNSRYEDRPGRNYQPASQSRPDSGQSSSGRYSSRRYENFADTIPPGTEPADFDRYRNDYNDQRVVMAIPTERESKRDRELREAAARDWERTRDREIEQRERERMKEYEEYHRPSLHKSASPEKHRKRSNERSHERGKENKQRSEDRDNISSRDQTTESYKDHSHKNIDQYKSSERDRVSILVDLKKEPSLEKDKKRDDSTTPSKDKKKDKDKKKKKKEEGEKKEKKKKRKEKKEGLEKAKNEEKHHKVIEAKPIVVIQNIPSKVEDPLYGDIEGTTVDKEVVENYGKVEQIQSEGDVVQGAGDVNTPETKENVVLAPLPELSKWELDEEMPSQEDGMSGDDPSSSAEKKIVTSEVLKRAENAIFQKAINAIRPIDVGKKPTIPEKGQEKDKKEKKDAKESGSKEEITEEPIPISPEDESKETREARKVANSIQITIPTHQVTAPERSVEIAVTTEASDFSKNRSRSERTKLSSVPVVPSSPVRVPAKERLGAKVDTDRDEIRRVRSAVEQKSRSRSPKRYFDRKYSERDKPRDISPGGRRVTVGSSWSRDKERDENRRERVVSESSKGNEKRIDKPYDRDRDRRKEKDRRSRSTSKERKQRKEVKPEKIVIKKRDDRHEERRVTVKLVETQETNSKKVKKNPKLLTERKKSVLDEANFEPDYDECEPDSEPEVPGEEKNLLVNVSLNQDSPAKKRSRSPSEGKEKKKLKSDFEVKAVPEKTTKDDKIKKIILETEDSSESDSSTESSSDSSVDRKKHRKKKKSKKRKKKKTKKRKTSSTESDSSESSSSDSDSGKKKRKHKHRKKSSKSKKRKKSKHK